MLASRSDERVHRMNSVDEIPPRPDGAVATITQDGRINLDFSRVDDLSDADLPIQSPHESPRDNAEISVPPMNICIMIVGTRGDVQPFIGIAKRLQQDGHRVRLATHAVYREFVTDHDVEFYPLGGDPKELAAYMVKTGGHLIPVKFDVITKDVPRNMQMIEEIINSTWPAVSAPDPDALGPGLPGRPFQAQAIISNPVTYGHIHVAERLGVPLHIMFPQPWVPTVAFPHPLSNLPYEDKLQRRNYLSYKLVEILMWEGTGVMINDFRTKVLGLRKIRKGDGGPNILIDLAIPHAFMWSPALVPKPADWGRIYNVVGTVLLKEAGSKYSPTPELEAFLGSDGGPIFVGFGSMVIADPKATTLMIIEAARRANARVLIQSSWSDMAAGIEVPDHIFFLGNCPHDWLMPRVSAVVHHGGAGTTAAGLLAGKPTFIVPFFGDQPFWGRAVVRAGVGVEPCPIAKLTVEKLHAAFVGLQTKEIRDRALALRDVMQDEDGVAEAVRCFYQHLPLKVMRCEICEKLLATKWSEKDKIRLCFECEYIISSRATDPVLHVREYQCVDYRAHGPDSVLEGVASGTGALLHEVTSGVKDIFTRPVQGFREHGATGAVMGLVQGLASSVVVRPVQGVAIFADHVATGHYNYHRRASERKVGSVWLENSRFGISTGYGTGPAAHVATMKRDDAVRVKNPLDARKLAVPVSTRDRRQLALRFRELLAARDGTIERTPVSPNSGRTVIPKMHVCLIVTGSWRVNVGHFVSIGLRLQADGHRVRIASHECFRNRISAAGLEFFSLGGTEDTVANFLQYIESQQHEKRRIFGRTLNPERDFKDFDDLRSLIFSLWPACVEAKPASPGLQFRADLIISEPFIFGQTTVATRLGVPLHCVSTIPHSRTKAFPPIFKPSRGSDVPLKNNATMYDVFDALVAEGLKRILYPFQKSLDLPNAGHKPLVNWSIPHSYLWDESLLPKPRDWSSEILVAGFVGLSYHYDNGISPAHQSEEASIQAFKDEDSTPIIYVGFVREDWNALGSEKLFRDLESASTDAHVRVLLHIVESHEADHSPRHRSKNVFEVSSELPISSLHTVASGAIHWGDVSVLSTWLMAGVPSSVVVRSSTGRFWGQILAKACVGVEPIDIDTITSSTLATAFQRLVSDADLRENARRIGQQTSTEDAIGRVVQHVYDMLPLDSMRCDLDPTRVAHVYDPHHELKLSYEAHLVVQAISPTSDNDVVRYHPLKYTAGRGPRTSLCPAQKKRTKKNLRPLLTYELPDYRKRPGVLAKFQRVSVEEKQQKTKTIPVVEAPSSWSSPEVERLRAGEVIGDYARLLAAQV